MEGDDSRKRPRCSACGEIGHTRASKACLKRVESAVESNPSGFRIPLKLMPSVSTESRRQLESFIWGAPGEMRMQDLGSKGRKEVCAA